MRKHTLLFDEITAEGIIFLLYDNILIDFVSFGEKGRKNDSVLSNLAILLERNDVDRNEVEKILISDSDTKEGKSLTRSRILRAILLGLKNSLNLNVFEISETERFKILTPYLKERLLYASDNNILINLGN